jgi:hypothetical protein
MEVSSLDLDGVAAECLLRTSVATKVRGDEPVPTADAAALPLKEPARTRETMDEDDGAAGSFIDVVQYAVCRAELRQGDPFVESGRDVTVRVLGRGCRKATKRMEPRAGQSWTSPERLA